MRLRYTRPALSDLASILDYIEERSPQGAAHTQARIQAVMAAEIIIETVAVVL